MKAKLNWKDIGRFIAVLVQLITVITNVFKKAKVGPEIVEWLIGPGKDVLVAKLEELAMEFIKVVEKTTRLLKEVGKVMLPATVEKKTEESFVGDRYHRSLELNRWLSKVQPAGKEGSVIVYQLEKQPTFREVAAAILGVDETSGLDFLAKTLIENGHTVVLSQVESLIERTDKGEDTGLLTNGYGNFFFVKNKDGGVSVVLVDRLDGWLWRVGVYLFDDICRWDVEVRFFSRNN